MKENTDALLGRMTLAEKAGQMTQLTLGVLLRGPGAHADKPWQFDEDLLAEAFSKYPIGSVLNTPGEALVPAEWHRIISRLQETASRTRLAIPVLYGIDSTHGAGYVKGATLFPHQIGMAASWDTDLVERAAAITALEGRAAGLPWNFAPVMDICMHPAWPRLYEGFGESPLLASHMGAAMVRGMQGESLEDPQRVAACLKHFVGYGAANSGKDRTPAYIPEHVLRQIHLPPFEAAIRAGAASIMVNSGDVNGIPVHASRWLLHDILRGELGFEGLVVTDWMDIQYLHTRHRVASSHREAVKMALLAGVDMSMVPEDLSFPAFVVDLVEKGEISESRIDESVRRILNLKMALGLFDKPMGGKAPDYQDVGSKAHKSTAQKLATAGITLLKNDRRLLPLSPSPELTICLTGPASHSRRALVGGWSHTWQGEMADEVYDTQVPTLKEVMQTALGDRLRWVPGTDFSQEIDIDAALSEAKQADCVVCCLGEESYTEFFGNIHDLSLNDAQLRLASALLDTGKPVIFVLLHGRPRNIAALVPRAAAVLTAYLPGEAGGRAIADVLFGRNEPEGRLPFTWPSGPNAPEGLHATHSEYTMPQNGPVPYAPLFPFGHGLSYTRFQYELMHLSETRLTDGQEFSLTVRVRNVGERPGSEVVQVYMRDHYASVVQPWRRLVRFEKISLEKGEHRDVRFSLSTDDLTLVNAENRRLVEPGEFSLICGPLETSLEVVKGD
ncbi:MAG: glycoside hydrolase family 3 N-terminal domain-containing protein [Bacteroidia bacterium]